ncbi:hypothetical protein ACH4MN_16030 [Streptomyces anulatus]
MNFQSPLSALFPGASGRLLTALVARHATDPSNPLTVEELSRNASVTSGQLEAPLFRLGLLGLVAPRRQGEDVRLVEEHITWAALHQVVGLRGQVVDLVRGKARVRLPVDPRFLGAVGPVIDGSATHPADVLELIIVPPASVPDSWDQDVAGLVAELSTCLGNVVVYRAAGSAEEAGAMGGPRLIAIFGG